MPLPTDVNDSPNYTSDDHADHHNALHAEYNTPAHAHSGTYVPLPAGAPTNASQILGLSDDDPLTTDWIDAPSSSIAEGRAKPPAGSANLTVPGVHFSGVSTNSLASNRLYYLPMMVATAITLDQLVVEVTTLVASGLIRLGIYNADTDWQPTSLVLDAGTIDSSSTGVKTVSISQVLPAGRYVLAAHSNSGTHAVRVLRAWPGFVGANPNLGAGPWSEALYKSSVTFGALASTGVAWETQTAQNVGFNYFVFCRVSTP